MEEKSRLSFSLFGELCGKNADRKYVNEILHSIRYEDCLYRSMPTLPYDQIYATYTIRLRIAKDQGRDVSHIADFEALMENMRMFKSQLASIVSVMTASFIYFVFYTPDTEMIFGILRWESSGLADRYDFAEGGSSAGGRYSKGVLVKDRQPPIS